MPASHRPHPVLVIQATEAYLAWYKQDHERKRLESGAPGAQESDASVTAEDDLEQAENKALAAVMAAISARPGHTADDATAASQFLSSLADDTAVG